MKFGVLRKIPKEQLAKSGNLPPWIDALMDPLNDFIEKVGTAMQGNIDFENNFLSRVKRFKLTHATELVINPDSKLKVLGVLVLSAEGLAVDSTKWNDKGNGTIGVTVNFSSGTSALCDLLILFRGG